MTFSMRSTRPLGVPCSFAQTALLVLPRVKTFRDLGQLLEVSKARPVDFLGWKASALFFPLVHFDRLLFKLKRDASLPPELL